MTTAQQWREAALELRRQAEKFEQNARKVEALTTVRLPPLCSVVSQSGPNGEPLACAYVEGHDGDHSWATLPTWTRCDHGSTVAHYQDHNGTYGSGPAFRCPGPTDDERPATGEQRTCCGKGEYDPQHQAPKEPGYHPFVAAASPTPEDGKPE